MKQPGFKRRMIRLQSRAESFQCWSAFSARKAKPQAQAAGEINGRSSWVTLYG